MATFPHDYTMKKYGLVESDLSEDASDALEEFEQFLAELTRQKKEFGSDWTMTKAQQKKINRISRAVCTEVEMMIEDAPEEKPASKPESNPEPKAEVKAHAESKVEPTAEEEDGGSVFDFFW